MNRIFLFLLLTGAVASAQSNAPVEMKPAPTVTNEPVFYVPTPEQKKLAGSRFFKTQVNERDRVVTHVLSNPSALDASGSVISTVLAVLREGKPATFQFIILLAHDPDAARLALDGSQPLVFLADGVRFVTEDQSAIARERMDYAAAKAVHTYTCNVTEEIVRALGAAKRAAVRVPCKGTPYDHYFNAVELRRFAIFVEVFLPKLSSTKTEVAPVNPAANAGAKQSLGR
jgi:hypothetical protein